ncbi:MAG: hypothetical protein R2774_00365 [Saprospiraceae bacterium]
MQKSNLHYISYYFPPIESIASVRNYYIFQSLVSYFEDSKIYVSSNKRFFEKNEINPDQNEIITFTFDYRTILQNFNSSKNKQFHLEEEKKQSKLAKIIIKLNETIPINLLVGEGGFFFIFGTIYKILNNIDNNVQNVIFTPYRPTANIVIGFISKVFNPKLYWIISMHDIPYVDKRPNTYFKNLQIKFWKAFFKKADCVISVSKGVSNALTEFGVDALTIINGVEIRNPNSANNKKFSITFTGSIHEGLIDPNYFFICLEKMLSKDLIDAEKFEIIYAGKDAKFWSNNINKYNKLSKVSNITGLVDRRDALLIQQNSNINFLMSWNDVNFSGNLTGKLFEYIGARNPILTLIQGKYDEEFETLFETLKCGKIFYTSDSLHEEKIITYILNMYSSWINGDFQSNYNDVKSLDTISWEHQVKLLIDSLPN